VSPPNAPRGTRNKADIIAVMGASGTGKSSYIKGELLKRYDRLLVWSPLEDTDDYGGFSGGVVVRSRITELVANVQGDARAIVYQPTGDKKAVDRQFDAFCRIAWEMGQGTKVLVEELSGVTMPSWSPPAWRKLSTAGRHKGLTVIGVAQRPANIDKDFLGNCTEIRCYRLNYGNDAKTMADALRLQKVYAPDENGKPVAKNPIDQLRELPNFHFFHKNPDLSVRRGVNKSL
jgi:hypothetical protein